MNHPAAARSVRWLLVSIVPTLLQAGCSDKKPENTLASAREALAKNDSKAAIIPLKNEQGRGLEAAGRCALVRQGPGRAGPVRIGNPTRHLGYLRLSWPGSIRRSRIRKSAAPP